mmetsp:Transcript_17920/g.53947  ORF Transcript_17920/g.53947 Transcript_17920/m.53947 type:complete len:227 (+) Transcript_17920:580-1260(+)
MWVTPLSLGEVEETPKSCSMARHGVQLRRGQQGARPVVQGGEEGEGAVAVPQSLPVLPVRLRLHRHLRQPLLGSLRLQGGQVLYGLAQQVLQRGCLAQPALDQDGAGQRAGQQADAVAVLQGGQAGQPLIQRQVIVVGQVHHPQGRRQCALRSQVHQAALGEGEVRELAALQGVQHGPHLRRQAVHGNAQVLQRRQAAQLQGQLRQSFVRRRLVVHADQQAAQAAG